MMNHGGNPLLLQQQQQQQQQNPPIQGQYDLGYQQIQQQQQPSMGGYGGSGRMPTTWTPPGVDQQQPQLQQPQQPQGYSMMYPPITQGMMQQNSPQMMMQSPQMMMQQQGYAPQAQLAPAQQQPQQFVNTQPMPHGYSAIQHSTVVPQSYPAGGSSSSISSSFHQTPVGGGAAGGYTPYYAGGPGTGGNQQPSMATANFHHQQQQQQQHNFPSQSSITNNRGRTGTTTMRPPFIDPNTQIIYDVDNSEYEGWLTKQSDWLKEWRRRYFILKGNKLFFGKNPHSAPHGMMDLAVCTTVKSADLKSKKRHSFEISTPETCYLLYADTEGEKDDWIGRVGKAIVRSSRTFEPGTSTNNKNNDDPNNGEDDDDIYENDDENNPYYND